MFARVFAREFARELRHRAAYRRGGAYRDLPPEMAVRLAFNVLLEREPDAGGRRTFVDGLRSGKLTGHDVIAGIRGSDEFFRYQFFADLGPSIHYGRGVFVRSLPAARRILDLGGSSRCERSGAMVAFGYPYPFDELVIVDLPSEQRHDLYKDDEDVERVQSPMGPVTYRYHSMVDLSAYGDGAFDLVYSGQTIEHVTAGEADAVRAEGINFAGGSVTDGNFDLGDTARHWGLYDDLERCYILAYVCRTPG